MSGAPMDQRRTFPWMPVYVDELLALAATLTSEQLGAFMRLRAHAWRQEPPCTVPDDDDELAILSGLGDRWAGQGRMIRDRLALARTPEGRLVITDLQKRYDEQLRKHLVKSLNGSKGGRPRKQDGNQSGNQMTKLGESSALRELSSLSVLGSTTEGRTENLEQSNQAPKLGETSGFGFEADAFDVRALADDAAVTRWLAEHPDELAEIERNARATIGIPASGDAPAWTGPALEAVIAKNVRQRMHAGVQS